MTLEPSAAPSNQDGRIHERLNCDPVRGADSEDDRAEGTDCGRRLVGEGWPAKSIALRVPKRGPAGRNAALSKYDAIVTKRSSAYIAVVTTRSASPKCQSEVPIRSASPVLPSNGAHLPVGARPSPVADAQHPEASRSVWPAADTVDGVSQERRRNL